ncbi:hypothetical protein [Halomarina ordinaria]|uniref:DUF8147 domain-containing protein n=1 Tax=Halomarina ordinaria TaxID=3033939 RepID=A0ABD5UES9_9EURY|nr:hypothetical protein [Halomarina sp. PSRA2]
MNYRVVGTSVVAALVVSLAVAVVVTGLLAARVWPSALVGLPAGAVAGVVTYTVVHATLQRRLAAAV